MAAAAPQLCADACYKYMCWATLSTTYASRNNLYAKMLIRASRSGRVECAESEVARGAAGEPTATRVAVLLTATVAAALAPAARAPGVAATVAAPASDATVGAAVTTSAIAVCIAAPASGAAALASAMFAPTTFAASPASRGGWPCRDPHRMPRPITAALSTTHLLMRRRRAAALQRWRDGLQHV